MDFKILGKIIQTRTFAIGRSVREFDYLNRIYGTGNWQKRKGIATVKFENGETRLAELHWCEDIDIGRKEFKIKQFLDYRD